MKLKRQLIISSLIIFFLLATSCETLTYMQMAADDVKQNHNERYGSGTSTDMLTSDIPSLTPWYSRINLLYDNGEITKEERDRRKIRLTTAHKQLEKMEISRAEYNRILDECINK